MSNSVEQRPKVFSKNLSCPIKGTETITAKTTLIFEAKIDVVSMVVMSAPYIFQLNECFL